MKKFIYPLLIKGAKEGEEKERQLLLSLGFSEEQLSSFSKGDLSKEDLISGYKTQFENSLKDRIGQHVEATKKSEIFKAVHSKNEKLVCEAFGLDYAKYKELDEKGRLGKILSEVTQLQSSKLEEIKSKYSNLDQNKVKELERVFEQRKIEIEQQYKTQLQEKEAALESLKANNQKVILDNFRKSKNTKFFSQLKNPAFSSEVMEIIINSELSGYNTEITEDNIAYLLKDGVKVAHPTNPSKNLTYSDLLEIVSEKRQFEKKSKGSEDKTFDIPKEEIDRLKSSGVSQKVIDERQKHFANLKK